MCKFNLALCLPRAYSPRVSDDKPSAAASAAHADPTEGGEERVQQEEEEEAAVPTQHTLRQSHAPGATVPQETPARPPL